MPTPLRAKSRERGVEAVFTETRLLFTAYVRFERHDGRGNISQSSKVDASALLEVVLSTRTDIRSGSHSVVNGVIGRALLKHTSA